jgi:dihydrofolate reductase
MGKVIFDMSVSVDGFMNGANAHIDNPMGDGGEQLHDWAMGGDEQNRVILQNSVGGLGALISGRRNYDNAIRWWGANGPTGDARRPLFVVTHEAPKESPENGVYTFVTGGIEQALQMAKAAAGDKDVAIMGGADIGQQYLRAGLVDEIGIHVIPVLFGSGTRMLEHFGDEHLQLEVIDVIPTPTATHIRYRIVK